MMEQIIQIMPAADWYSVYDVDSNGRAEELIIPVVCWALLEDDEEGLRRVDAIDDGTKGWDGTFASEASNFNRFFYSKDKQPLCAVSTRLPRELGAVGVSPVVDWSAPPGPAA